MLLISSRNNDKLEISSREISRRYQPELAKTKTYVDLVCVDGM